MVEENKEILKNEIREIMELRKINKVREETLQKIKY